MFGCFGEIHSWSFQASSSIGVTNWEDGGGLPSADPAGLALPAPRAKRDTQPKLEGVVRTALNSRSVTGR
jgi:hypothetical protein